jgi:hypothetical protein
MAQLAAEGMFFAIRYRIRAGKVVNPRKDFKQDVFEVKNCMTWLSSIADGSHKVASGRDDEPAFIAVQVLAEIQLKFVSIVPCIFLESDFKINLGECWSLEVGN